MSRSAPGRRVAMVTGAAQGIGRATAGALAERGYRVGLLDRAGDPLRAWAETRLQGQAPPTAPMAGV